MRTKLLSLLFSAICIISVGCSSTDPNDPFEPYNRAMYKTNRAVDKYTLKPISQAYEYVTPDFVEHRVSNFFDNIKEVNTFANSILQGKLHNAAVSSARIVWNTTLGLGGLFDVATEMNLQSQPEDLGQTLRTWGAPAGPYFVLPIFGPSTITDSIGKVGDYYISPMYHYDWPNNTQKYGVTALNAINTRSRLSGLDNILENGTIDEYSFVKNSYLQRREAQTRDGASDSKVDEAFDELFEDKN